MEGYLRRNSEVHGNRKHRAQIIMSRDVGKLPSSGKTAREENFPVASVFFSASVRAHVKTFYRFARAADDIADTASLSPTDKLAMLEAFADTIGDESSGDSHYAEAQAMRNSLLQTHITPQHCHDLIRAFSQDAIKDRYASWQELMDYCMLSAAPVGRYLLDLHGEPVSAYAASDALCNALQIINHLQDCKKDYQELDRVYLPQNWLRDENVPLSALSDEKASPGLRHVLDRCLLGVEDLLAQTTPLAEQIASARLAMNATAIWAIAHKLVAALRQRDPVAGRVALNSWQYITCMMAGIWKRTKTTPS